MKEEPHHAFSGDVEKDPPAAGGLPAVLRDGLALTRLGDFAMRLAFDETNHVYVQDTRRDEIVRDFDAPVYRD